MIVMGVDPGLRVSGYAVVEQIGSDYRVLDAGVIRVSDKPELAERLNLIYQDFDEILSEQQPNLMAIEQLYSHYNHPRTAVIMGHARGVFLVAAAQHMLRVEDYAATRIKKSVTGNGRASKEQVQRAVMGQLRLKTAPEPVDVSDALAIALCCLNENQREKIKL